MSPINKIDSEIYCPAWATVTVYCKQAKLECAMAIKVSGFSRSVSGNALIVTGFSVLPIVHHHTCNPRRTILTIALHLIYVDAIVSADS